MAAYSITWSARARNVGDTLGACARPPLRRHQRSRALQVTLDGIYGPIGERADRTGRVLAGVLGESTCAGDKNVRHVPGLGKPIERTGFRICPEHGPAGDVSALFGHVDVARRRGPPHGE